jgi:hypothetical protein
VVRTFAAVRAAEITKLQLIIQNYS